MHVRILLFLSNFVIHFSDFIMPLCILLFSFEFSYSLSHYVTQLSNSIIRLYNMVAHYYHKICICSVILEQPEPFRNYKGLSINFPKILDAI